MENKDYNAPSGDYTTPEQENIDNPYSRPNYETAEEYNQARREAEGQSTDYGQNYGNPYNNTQYNNAQYANLGGTPVDAAGNPLKSYFALQLVFAIIEIVCCCLSPVAMILGIIALVFAVQANTAYNQGRGEEFKAKSKTSNILLIIGGVFAAISLILNIAVFALMPQILEETYNYIEEYEDEFYDEEFYDDEDSDVLEEYIGTNETPLVEGFEGFTLNGISYEIPMTYEDFGQMGYGIEGLDGDFVFEAQTFEYFDIYDANDNLIGSIRISNDTQDALSAEDCVIDYIMFFNDAAYDNNLEMLNLTFGNGFDMNTSYEELKAWLGDPYYVYEENMDGSTYQNYMWEYNGDDKYQRIDIYYLDGVISEIEIEQFDWVY